MEDRSLQLAAASDASREAWMEALQNASYENLQLQLLSLQNEIISATGKDPLEGKVDKTSSQSSAGN